LHELCTGVFATARSARVSAGEPAPKTNATPLIAESAPDGFLDALDELLAESPTVLSELLKDDGGIFGESRHAGLLSALESLAWSPVYLTRVTGILGRLAAIDPGGRCPIGHITEPLGPERLETTCRYYLGLDVRAAGEAHRKFLRYE
jgi:hypothetical protein